MTKWILAAGAAAIALASPAAAERGGGQKGGDQKSEKAGKSDRGGQSAKSGRGGGDKHVRTARHDDGGKVRVARAERADKNFARKDDRRVKAEVRDRVRIVDRDDRRGKDDWRGKDDRRGDDDRRLRYVDRDRDSRFARYDRDRRWGNDCPPGLDRKDNGCLPPGQAKKMIGALLPAAFASRTLDGAYSQWYRDDDRYFYRSDDDYIYRVNRNGGLIDALFPFADRDYSYYPVGMSYPSTYDSYNVPYQYRSFYPDGGDYDYRYGDGAIYQVDPSTNAIQSIVALLAGDLGVGQAMPANYGAYNVPLAYRDRYYDTPDAMYRYNDGYIYRADPKTQLITAVIDALV